MSRGQDDVPVPDGPGGGTAPAASGPARPMAVLTGHADFLFRRISGWHVSFWLVSLLMLAQLGTDDDLGPARRGVGVAAVLLLGAAYALLVQRVHVPGGSSSLDDPGRREQVYLGCVVVACGVFCAVDVALAMFLFMAYTQVWVFAPHLRAGASVSVAVTVTSTMGIVAGLGEGPGVVLQVLPQMVVGLGFSFLMGAWITNVVEQSHERARLLEQIGATRAELAAAHQAQGAAAERERLAREIHDTLAQGFTSIVMLAQTAAVEHPPAGERLALIEEVARENLAEARALVAAFAPAPLADATLAEALRRIGQRAAAQGGFTVQVGAGPTMLTRADEVVVLRTVQEALANVVRHAGARQVEVVLGTGAGLEATAGEVVVEVRDDGRGFDPAAPGAGFGLPGLRARAASAGCALVVVSAPGRGTTVRLVLPGRHGDAAAAVTGDDDGPGTPEDGSWV